MKLKVQGKEKFQIHQDYWRGGSQRRDEVVLLRNCFHSDFPWFSGLHPNGIHFDFIFLQDERGGLVSISSYTCLSRLTHNLLKSLSFLQCILLGIWLRILLSSVPFNLSIHLISAHSMLVLLQCLTLPWVWRLKLLMPLNIHCFFNFFFALQNLWASI
jgi:hypothetical protein